TRSSENSAFTPALGRGISVTTFGTSRFVAASLLLIALIGISIFADGRRSVVVSFMATADEPGRLQLFHAPDGAYSEHQSDWFDLSTRPSEQAARIPADESLRLRLDPP